MSLIIATVLYCQATSFTEELQDAGSLGIAQIKRGIEVYKDKLSSKGKIVWTVKSKDVSEQIVTDFQYLRPNKVYVRQDQLFGSKAHSLLVSDGKNIVYSPGSNLNKTATSEYVFEPVFQERTKKLLMVEDIITIGQVGFIDRSIALDLIFDRDDNFIHLNGILTKVELGDPGKINGVDCSIVVAKMRIDYNSEPTIPIQFAFNEKDELVQIKTVEQISDGKTNREFVMTWDVTAIINDESVLDAKKFILPKPDKN